MSKERDKGRKWDGVSRVPTDKYKENWEEIFGKKEQEELKASYKQSLANKKERKQKEKNEPKTRVEQMEKLTHDPIID
tara:strand:+ start:61 stop:294 length:234 start_codon:yes stop_codon:yes gene_type:complete